ncbi:hypothetical protein KXW19_005080 [Aspergillus fumigatus]|nr:hypothetical protein KXW05_007804 [Aspergillus fumigatus]KAH3529408.1 hypothetical protein KXV93_007839 [Aspergillus fumigatus]KAH3546657.1 hypothetical protein KXW19_005080 [Aspergillus fumigatus]KAH3597009.1 hypothetical protein KXW46_008360 [Aspergillus fumigatus]
MASTSQSRFHEDLRDDGSILDDDLIEADDAIEADDPLHTSDTAPLRGNIQSEPSSSSRGGFGSNLSSNYLTSTIPGEDRRATQNTIDETVWETLSRDLRAVWEKMRQVLWPKYLMGGMLQRGGGGIGAAERGEATGFGGGLRGLVGRWPDADVVLQGGMSEGLRDWDLWGPLIFCLLLSMFLSMRAKDDQSSLVFSGVFSIVWIGEAVVTLQIKLLGGNISFFQSVCIIGYTLFPLVIAAMLSALGLPTIARIPVYLALIAWSLAAGVSILGGSGVIKNRVGIAVYPLFVFYIAIGCLCFIRTTAEDSQASDNEETERPVRQKLKETSITSSQQETITKNGEEATGAKMAWTTDAQQSADTNNAMGLGGGSNSRSSSRGRKRSFDDDEAESDGEEHGHRRKRSRDSTSEGDDQPPRSENDLPRKILSPKKKRSRDKLDEDGSGERATEKADTKIENMESEQKPESEGQPEKKRHRDNSTERKPTPVTSAFANTSTVSPFGSLGASKSKEDDGPTKPAAVTSASAFASSSLAAFAGSEQSPFGSLGASTPSVFKSPAASETEKPAAAGFAAGANTSGFAALGSGFSVFSGGFGTAAKPGGLTSFASPAAPSPFGSSTKDKPFGAADADEEEEEEGEAETGPKEFEAEKPDERFFERQIETGEEQEKTYFSGKAKLFQFTNKEWKERGIGTFKVNVRVTDGQEDKKAARMIMRADGVLRVMLNTPLFKGMKVGDPSGNEPKSKQIHLAGVEDGRTVPLLLRVGSEDVAKELYHVIQDLLQHQ